LIAEKNPKSEFSASAKGKNKKSNAPKEAFGLRGQEKD
jgi:hypothetical protein